MFPRLPPRANLEHLKKEAKAILRVFKHHKPGWRLANAQHAVARGYGFSSWFTLKTHVESVTSSRRCDETRLTSGHAASPAVEGSTDAHPMVGTWMRRAKPLDTNRADHEAMMSVDVAGAIVTMTYATFGQPADESAVRVSIRADGHEHPLEPGSAEVLRARWISLRLLELILARGSEIVGRGQYEVSETGTVLIVSTADRVVVFERG